MSFLASNNPFIDAIQNQKAQQQILSQQNNGSGSMDYIIIIMSFTIATLLIRLIIRKRKNIGTILKKIILNIKIYLKPIIINPTNMLLALVALVIIIHFGIQIYKAIKPQTYQEKYMHCLELGSNERFWACVRLLENDK